MKKSPADQGILHLLVSVYNQSIQTYFYFPEVILCGPHRLEREEFEQLLHRRFIESYAADSFGCYYRLSKHGEDFLLNAFPRRRHKQAGAFFQKQQGRLPFLESC